MSLQDVEMIFRFIGGLGMFLYGMHVMSDGLQKSAGNKTKRLMQVLTKNRFMAVLAGIAVTAVLQSSSATTVMVVGFVNAGIMDLAQAVGVIMGANIGTTVTSWIVSADAWGFVLKPDFFAPLLIGIGAFILVFARKEGKRQAGEIMAGLGILFIGVSFMYSAISPYRGAPLVVDTFHAMGENPFLGILAGLVITAVLQNSGASVGILQVLSMCGIVSWNSGIFIMLGQNLGTCVTALLSSIGAHRTAKRAALIHFLFNGLGVLIFGAIMGVIFYANPAFAWSGMGSVEIAAFHSIFNIANTALLFPFAGQLVRLTGIMVKKKNADNTREEKGIALRHLDERILGNPAFAVENTVSEVIRMGQMTYESVKLSFDACLFNSQEKIRLVYEYEKDIDQMAREISDYLVKVSGLSLSERQHQTINHLFYTVSDIERIGDHAENLAELAQFKVKNHIEFSRTAGKELQGLMEYVTNSMVYALRARQNPMMGYVTKAREYEEQVDYVEGELREKHIERLAANLCAPRSGVVFLDILTNLERIADHADNIAGYVKNEL